MGSLENWIVDQGLNGSSVASLLSGFAEHLNADGIPIMRAYLALPTVNPMVRVYNHIWTRSSGILVEGVSHDRNTDAFEVSPFGHMLRNGLTGHHWHFHTGESQPFAAFEDIRREGGRDYLARLISFDNASAPALQGVAAAFSSERDSGFLPSEVERIDAALPLLALAAYRMTLFDLTVSVLDTYLGLSAGQRVLKGEIRRGAGSMLKAALLFADLRGFTALADEAGIGLIARLDRHFDAMAEPVLDRGGEILKFMGDGLLAVFPISPEHGEDMACAAAVRAAQEAVLRNQAVNRSFAGEPPLNLDIALHCGDVFYGNIGTASRLDFTVIGPAVNEVSRIEALCATLDCSVLMSASVAALSPAPTRHLGRHSLRGIAAERDLYTLAA